MAGSRALCLAAAPRSSLRGQSFRGAFRGYPFTFNGDDPSKVRNLPSSVPETQDIKVGCKFLQIPRGFLVWQDCY